MINVASHRNPLWRKARVVFIKMVRLLKNRSRLKKNFFVLVRHKKAFFRGPSSRITDWGEARMNSYPFCKQIHFSALKYSCMTYNNEVFIQTAVIIFLYYVYYIVLKRHLIYFERFFMPTQNIKKRMRK